MNDRRLRLGTRASALARWQANWVAAQLISRGVEVALVPITTRGDAQPHDTIAGVGSPGVFTKELQRALLDEQVDLAVHSLKDLPTDEVAGLCLAAVPERESPYDALVSRQRLPLAQLPRAATIGTGSLRRRAQLLHARSDLRMRDVRGNVDTRLEKLAAGEYDALVLAYAGLRRLGRDAEITAVLGLAVMLPAVGQGALGIETRADDVGSRAAIAPLEHAASRQAVTAERALLAAVGGGCLAPVGAWARIEEEQLCLDAAVLSPDGRERIAASGRSPIHEPSRLGAEVAERLLALGAAELIGRARGEG
jgi:hydroxymethylbilane synthase